MSKMIWKQICVFMAGLMIIGMVSSIAAVEEKQQGAKTIKEGKEVEVAPEPGLLKENICRNPKLCESFEIDMLNSLQKSKVPAYVPPPDATGSTMDYKVSLNLGIAVADALSSIINKDKPAFLKYADMICDYARRLGMPEPSVVKYNRMLTNMANGGEWSKLGTSVYELKDNVTTELQSKNKKDDATLAMVSGAMEGLFITAKSLHNKFSADAAEVLHEPELVKYQEKYMALLSEDSKSKGEVKSISAALPKIDKVIAKPKTYTYSKDDVTQLLNILEPVRKHIIKD